MSQAELAPKLNGADTIQLVPNTGVQFIDFDVTLSEVNIKFELAYTAIAQRGQEHAAAQPASTSGEEVGSERLIALVDRDRQTDEYVTIDGQRTPDDHVFAIDQATLIAACCERWFPLPFLRKAHGSDRLDVGPTNWVRSYLRPLDPVGLDGVTHRLVIAVDTTVDEPSSEYTAPTTTNISQNAEAFRFAVGDASLSDFLATQEWVAVWAKNTCLMPERIRYPEVVSNYDDILEKDRFRSVYPFALYCAYLRWIGSVIRLPEFHFLNTGSETSRVAEIPVDLVLDVGNSRTCGILFEHTETQSDLKNCYSMKLRDLSDPIFLHKGPFTSRMEFVDFSFGDEFAANLTLNVSQRRAFQWPSMTRLGAEAQRLAGRAFGNEGDMGLSSPKRYIWDTEPTINTWYLNPHGRTRLAGAPRLEPDQAAKGDLAMSFTETGERVTDDNPIPAVTPHYSRSAMMTHFLAELFLQAVNQVNAPYVRYNRKHFNRHRRIRRIVLTVPTAMTIEERFLFQRRARDAQEMLWSVLGYDDVEVELLDQWDEAVATQAVFLYNEICAKFKFNGNMVDFFSQEGSEREVPRGLSEILEERRIIERRTESAPSLRIASLDIGGGTTDLIVTTYYLIDGHTIVPHENFREGFNVAGDDILGDIVQKLILPKLANALAEADVSEPLRLLADLVGPDRESANVAVDHNMRRQFCSLVLIPAAIRLIEAYEDGHGDSAREVITLKLSDMLVGNPTGRAQLTAHLQRKNEEAGRTVNVSLFDTEIAMTTREIDNVVRDVIATIVSDLSEVVYAHDCDSLLLSGRPSRMPAVKALVLAHLPIAPHRLIAMHDYEVDDWYPFSNAEQKLDDPKTTVSVGAMICAMANRLPDFYMMSDQLKMRSTARFIGKFHGFNIGEESIYFENVDLDDEDLGGGRTEKLITFTAQTQIGFRQMRHPRWQATPYYELAYNRNADGSNRGAPAGPYDVRLRLRRPTPNNPRAIEIEDASDKSGRSVKPYISLRLKTLANSDGMPEKYWLDAGIFDLQVIREIAKSMRGG